MKFLLNSDLHEADWKIRPSYSCNMNKQDILRLSDRTYGIANEWEDQFGLLHVCCVVHCLPYNERGFPITLVFDNRIPYLRVEKCKYPSTIPIYPSTIRSSCVVARFRRRRRLFFSCAAAAELAATSSTDPPVLNSSVSVMAYAPININLLWSRVLLKIQIKCMAITHFSFHCLFYFKVLCLMSVSRK